MEFLYENINEQDVTSCLIIYFSFIYNVLFHTSACIKTLLHDRTVQPNKHLPCTIEPN